MRIKNKRCRERIQKGGLETKLATLLNNKPRNERWLKKSMGLVHLLLVELTSSDWCSTFGSLAVPVISLGIFKKNETEEYTERTVHRLTSCTRQEESSQLHDCLGMGDSPLFYFCCGERLYSIGLYVPRR